LALGTPWTAAETTALRAKGLSPIGDNFNTSFVLRLTKHERVSGPVIAVFRKKREGQGFEEWAFSLS
jgi:hypothetical protein